MKRLVAPTLSLLLALTFGMAHRVLAEGAAAQFSIIHGIEGADQVAVKGNSGMRQAKVGEELQEGDQIQLGGGVTVILKLPDGTELRVGQGTQVKFQKKVDDAQAFDLYTGGMRGTTVPGSKPMPGGKHRLYIRTRSAVLGVRGTDFVVEVDGSGQLAEVHTFEGQVEVAKDLATLRSGQFTPVAGDKYIRADASGISKPSAFDPSVLLDELKGNRPGLLRPEDAGPPSRFEVWRFRLGGLLATNSTGNSSSGLLSWAPRFRISDRWAAGALVGASMFKNLAETGGGTFLVLDSMAVAWYRFLPTFEAELGGGMQFWFGKDNALTGTAQISFVPHHPLFNVIDRVVAGYTFANFTATTSEIRLGIGIKL
ncbi:MAG TPA: FecR family protein [Bdellovibrionota bacterium]|jgi:hypothetical protein|nr:FecR family protein [Bdellovibrionota bacterium]